MKSIDEILFAISCKEGQCGDCAYYYDEDCSESIKKDAEKLIHSLLDENKALHTEIIASHGGYWGNICELNAKQETKGKSKYGVSLEDNTTLTRKQRIEHLEEEFAGLCPVSVLEINLESRYGFNKKEIDKGIENLAKKGLIYYPQVGYIRVVS